jgi:hypothetical protein
MKKNEKADIKEVKVIFITFNREVLKKVVATSKFKAGKFIAL